MDQLLNTAQVKSLFGGIGAVTLCKYRKLGIVPQPVNRSSTHPLWHSADIQRAVDAFRSAGA